MSWLKTPYWQSYWYRLRIRLDGAPGGGWSGLGSPEFSQVPNVALKTMSLQAWVTAFLAEAQEELDDLRGDLLLECFAEPVPPVGTAPVYSAEVALTGKHR